MDRRDWQATVHEVTRVAHDLPAKPSSPRKIQVLTLEL